MSFSVLTSSVNDPTKFYDGGDQEEFFLEIPFNGHRLSLGINTLSPECWNWRHYYSDVELNELWALLDLRFRFHVNRERLVDPVMEKVIFFHPFHVEGYEISVCYVYDEVSNGHFVAWLIAVVFRPLALEEYSSRVEKIIKYRHKGG